MKWGAYQKFFADVSKYLKLKQFCLECGISPSNLSYFIKFGSHSLSIEKLDLLYNHIINYFDQFA